MTASVELVERPNRLEELVWVLTDCSVTDALRATNAPPAPLGPDLALDVLAEALVRLGHVASPV